MAALARLPEHACTRCGEPFYESASVRHECGSCEEDPPPFDKARSLFFYRGLLRDKILAYKYHEELVLESALQELLVRGISEKWGEGLANINAVIPIPPDPVRGHRRGYNPPLRLALALVRRYRLPLVWSGFEREARAPQTELRMAERMRNVRGIFSCRASPADRERLCGKHVLVIDDVWTTGSTVREFAAFLKKELKVGQVEVLTLARR